MTTWINNTPPAISQDNLNAIENKITLLMNALYPVGAIYISTQQNNSTASTTGKMGCPIADFFGTWKRVQGSFLLAATPNGSSGASQAAGHTGGKATVTLTIDEIPAHSHKTGISGTEAMPFSYGSDSARVLFDQYSGVSTGEAGGGGPHENMPPYLAVYMWERTA